MNSEEQDLRERLDALRASYFNTEAEASDASYDALVCYYEKTYGKKYRPIGATCAKDLRKKVRLPIFMGSVKSKVKGEDCAQELAKYKEKYPGPWMASAKLDGIAGQYNVRSGHTAMYSRGDGHEGRDLSSILDYISLPVPEEDCIIRGELILPKSKFAEYAKREHARGSKNNWTCARSASSSFFNRVTNKDAQVGRDFHYVAFQTQSLSLPTLEDYQRLEKLGFRVPRHWILEDLTEEILEQLMQELQGDDYEYDGIVISPAHNAYPFPEGENPKHLIAFKIDASAVTTVRSIEWNASVKGNLTPIIHYDPIVLCGENCSSAKGHNAKFILERKIGPGAKVVVTMGGDIIPQVTETVTPHDYFQYPDCEYEWDATETNFIAKGSNEDVEIAALVHFADKLGIEGLKKGKATILYQNGVRTIYDLCELTVEQLVTFPSFAQKSAENLVTAIQASITNVNLAVLMAASNCFGIGFGEKKLNKIISAYPNILDYAFGDQVQGMIEALEGFDKTAAVFARRLPSFVEWLQDHPQITYLLQEVEEAEEEVEQTFAGETVVFTGFTDATLAREIEARGGRYASASSGKTTLVVAKDPSKKTNSIKKAVNARILSLAEFRAEFNL